MLQVSFRNQATKLPTSSQATRLLATLRAFRSRSHIDGRPLPKHSLRRTDNNLRVETKGTPPPARHLPKSQCQPRSRPKTSRHCSKTACGASSQRCAMSSRIRFISFSSRRLHSMLSLECRHCRGTLALTHVENQHGERSRPSPCQS